MSSKANTSFHLCKQMSSRGVARKKAREALPPPPPELVRSVNSIQTRVADYSPHTTASHPGFKKLSTPMSSVGSTKACFVTSVGDQIPISNDELTNLFAYVLDIFFKIK